ncbi:expressed unknown protein [Seminavis robusta]|uniref:Uncharacterized protein n=1 Tax=Seminavis robusta TaxID=568900 RepID=A0A9N8D8R8_9STRA|nr:expressed unknown protein [Seminavis robusta]|eukprot:Sro33_g021390.1 n/a (257) ;mRNA; r:65402-66298
MMNMMMLQQRPTRHSLLTVLFLTSLFPQVTNADSTMGFLYDNVAECSSSVVTMDSLAFDCDTSTGCTTHDEITITGQFTTTLPIPDEVNLKIQLCKFWGSMCTPILLDQDIDICNLFTSSNESGGDDEYYCASAGSYPFQETFSLPDWSLDNYAVNGFGFRIYVTANDEFNCHAQFTTVRSNDTTTTTVSILGIVFVLVSFLSVYHTRRRNKKNRTLMTRQDLEGNHHHHDNGDDDGGRVVDFRAMQMNDDHYVSL